MTVELACEDCQDMLVIDHIPYSWERILCDRCREREDVEARDQEEEN